MKSFLVYLIFSLVCTTVMAQVEHEPNVVIVKFEREFVENELQATFSNHKVKKAMPKFKSSRAAKLNAKHSVVNYSPVFRIDPRFVERSKAHGLDLYYRVEYSTGEDPVVVAASFVADNELVLEAEPNVVLTSHAGKANDTYYSAQWGLLNTSTIGMDINVEAAWEITTGNPKVIVAIIDDCIDLDHEDLRGNVWKNLAEVADNGVDEDGNGYIDDVYGWNFEDGNNNVAPKTASESHGTHVAGIVGARTGNSKGVAGVAGGLGNAKGASLMLTRVGLVNKDNPKAGSYLAQSLEYAANNGAAIAQCSWGGSKAPVIQAAVNYFTEFGGGEVMKGGLVIASSGNDGETEQQWPAADPQVLCVGSITEKGGRSGFSNYGSSWVDICAPGTDIMSTVPFTAKYESMDGTSMSTPMVSGVAALVLSAAINMPLEEKTPAWLKKHLISTGYDYDPEWEMGPLVDAGRAVEKIATSIRPCVDDVAVTTTVSPNPVAERLTIVNASPETTKAYALFRISGERVYQNTHPKAEETIEVGNLPNGTYLLQVETNSGFYTQKIVKN
ncbi:MAG: S8 family peptidase [Bacteroidales bacterium]|jgi:subtilisin family serine protease|nr:S8 family peptidase [Bacteroidales bacterium]